MTDPTHRDRAETREVHTELRVTATCAACPSRAVCDVGVDTPLGALVAALTHMHDDDGACRHAPWSLRVRISVTGDGMVVS